METLHNLVQQHPAIVGTAGASAMFVVAAMGMHTLCPADPPAPGAFDASPQFRMLVWTLLYVALAYTTTLCALEYMRVRTREALVGAITGALLFVVAQHHTMMTSTHCWANKRRAVYDTVLLLILAYIHAGVTYSTTGNAYLVLPLIAWVHLEMNVAVQRSK